MEYLSPKQMWQQMHDFYKRHYGNGNRYNSYRNTFDEYINNDHFVAETDKWVRARVLWDYEQRTDWESEKQTESWKEVNKEREIILKKELVQFDISLVEHLQGHLTMKNGKKRKRPSLWSAEHTQDPTTVEMAAANYFRGLGYNVSHSFGISLILLKAYCHLSYGEKEGHWLEISHFNPEKMSRANNVQSDQLAQILDVSIAKSISEYIDYELLRDDYIKNEKRLKMLYDMDYFKRGKFLETEFCNYQVCGTYDRLSLKDKIMLAHEQLPKEFLSEYFGNMAVYQQRSGIPDLFLWNADGFKFVEVKTPNDRVHLNQVNFHKYQIKKLGLKYNVAQVVPALLDN